MNSSLLSELMTMHRYCRPMGSIAESLFRRKYLLCLPGAIEDLHGNIHVRLGNEREQRVLFSSHTDTVHEHSGLQRVDISTDGIIRAIDLQKHVDRRRYPHDQRKPDCLGADDTAGVFLMRQMILHGIGGHYVFHWGEESGCEGSKSIAFDRAQAPDHFLDHTDMAIAFDRRDHGDVITHQCSTRTCSDVFADAFASAIGGDYKPSDEGLFTDTYSYRFMVPECTNVSVGYRNAHNHMESLDAKHVLWLLERLLSIDFTALPVKRDPSVIDVKQWFITTPRSFVRDYSSELITIPMFDTFDDDEDDRDSATGGERIRTIRMDDDAESFLTSWECIFCSRMNHWRTEICWTCSEEREQSDRYRSRVKIREA